VPGTRAPTWWGVLLEVIKSLTRLNWALRLLQVVTHSTQCGGYAPLFFNPFFFSILSTSLVIIIYLAKEID